MCGMAYSGSTLAAHQTSPTSWFTSESPRAGSRQVFSVMAQAVLKHTGTEDHNRQSPVGGDIVASVKEGEQKPLLDCQPCPAPGAISLHHFCFS